MKIIFKLITLYFLATKILADEIKDEIKDEINNDNNNDTTENNDFNVKSNDASNNQVDKNDIIDIIGNRPPDSEMQTDNSIDTRYYTRKKTITKTISTKTIDFTMETEILDKTSVTKPEIAISNDTGFRKTENPKMCDTEIMCYENCILALSNQEYPFTSNDICNIFESSVCKNFMNNIKNYSSTCVETYPKLDMRIKYNRFLYYMACTKDENGKFCPYQEYIKPLILEFNKIKRKEQGDFKNKEINDHILSFFKIQPKAVEKLKENCKIKSCVEGTQMIVYRYNEFIKYAYDRYGELYQLQNYTDKIEKNRIAYYEAIETCQSTLTTSNSERMTTPLPTMIHSNHTIQKILFFISFLYLIIII